MSAQSLNQAKQGKEIAALKELISKHKVIAIAAVGGALLFSGLIVYRLSK